MGFPVPHDVRGFLKDIIPAIDTDAKNANSAVTIIRTIDAIGGVIMGVLRHARRVFGKGLVRQRSSACLNISGSRFKRPEQLQAGGRIFGHVPGFPVGSHFARRSDPRASGVHRPPQAGISGSAAEGADSIVVSGGYEDDQDDGDVIIYTGQGGNDPATGKQVADQELKRGNLALARSSDSGLPVQVIHGLGIFGDRELHAPDPAAQGAAGGAIAMILNSLLWRFFRGCE